MFRRPFILEKSGRTIRGDLRIPEYPAGKPLLLFCHGFKGFKDWGGWQHALDRLCANGFHVISMNFSHNGIGPDMQNFTELDKFAVNTIGMEIGDIDCVFEELREGSAFPEFEDIPKTGLIGHSRGGGTVILHNAQKRDADALVTWASVANFENYLRQRDDWRRNGFIEQENKRTGQIMRMNVDFLNDLEAHPVERDILRAESTLGIPHLILHGDADEAVPIEQARQLYEASDKSRTQLEIIIGAGHTFGTVHPFTGTTPEFETLVTKTIEWFRKHLVDNG